MATPTVEKKSLPEPKESNKPKVCPPSSGPKLDSSNYESMADSSPSEFVALAKVVEHMKTRHLDGDNHPLTIDEILDKTNQLNVGSSVKNWLQSEALPNKPCIDVSCDGTLFSFKPVCKLEDDESLVHLLKKQYSKGLGGVLLDVVQESLPHCEEALKSCANDIICITRPDKKVILFYNDRSITIEYNLPVEEDFQILWRSVTVDAMDDAKIEEYLEEQGIRSMQAHRPEKPLIPKRKKIKNKKRQSRKPRDNEHLADVLETYEDNTITQEGAKIAPT